MTPERLMTTRLLPRKALKMLRFTFPVNRYYTHIMGQGSPSKPRRKTSFVVIFRNKDILWRMDVTKNEYEFLKQIISGLTIGEALEASPHVTEPQLSEWFARWMRNGIFANNTTEKET